MLAIRTPARTAARTWADQVRSNLRGCAPCPGTALTATLPHGRGRTTVEGCVEGIHRDGFVLRGRYPMFIAWVDLYQTDRPTRIVTPVAAQGRVDQAVAELRGGLGGHPGRKSTIRASAQDRSSCRPRNGMCTWP